MSSLAVEKNSLQDLASEVFGFTAARCKPGSTTITHNNGALHFLSWGDSSKPAVLCLHGGGQSSLEFALLGPALSDTHHVIALDYGGHGLTAWQYDQSSEYIASQIQAVCDYLHLSQFDILGSSMGAIHGVAFADRYPEKIGRIIVGDILPTLCPGILSKTQQYYTRFIEGGVISTEALERLSKSVAKTDLGKETVGMMLPDLYTKIEDHYYAQFDPTVPDFINDESFATFWVHFENVQCPLRILLSEKHSFVPEESIQRLCKKGNEISFHKIPDCGHNLVIDNPIAVVHHAREFFNADSNHHFNTSLTL